MVYNLAARDRIIFYSSENLIDWEFISEFTGIGEMNGVWECLTYFHWYEEGIKNGFFC